MRLGAVHLNVAELARSVAWYERALGLRVHARRDGVAELGDGVETTVVLHEQPGARPPGRHAGLYHYALLYPSRRALARAVVRLAVTRTPISGASDHRTHEAVYLPDADGIGIELAADRPRELWPDDLGYGRPLQRLDVDDLLATVADEPPRAHVDEGLTTGHVHLHVGDVDEALRFYSGVLGFDVTAHRGSAAFVAHGGYHHHVAMNVWQGAHVGPAPDDAAGLRHWTLELPAEALAAVRERAGVDGDGFVLRDPWRIAVNCRQND